MKSTFYLKKSTIATGVTAQDVSHSIITFKKEYVFAAWVNSKKNLLGNKLNKYQLK
jgi:hypothetical protein